MLLLLTPLLILSFLLPLLLLFLLLLVELHLLLLLQLATFVTDVSYAITVVAAGVTLLLLLFRHCYC